MILIAGAGIAGLSLGLTLHQIGIPFRIFEAAREIRPIGVGINIQPNAIRELFDLGLEADLDAVGIKTEQYGFYSKHGNTIWEEPRGTWAGYNWPQYSVHRGRFQVMLFEALVARAGPECVVTGQRAIGFDGKKLHLKDATDGHEYQAEGDLIVAADGIHSAIRAQMHPDEGPPIWGGAILWRATSLARPFFGKNAMVLIGHDRQRLVAYPISKPDPETGLATINWIAELRIDPSAGWKKEDWNRTANKDDFAPAFADWTFDWLDVPKLIQDADQVFEYPMVDRDPIDVWTTGCVTLMGDAAHPTYPVGSNGATQAVLDARVLGAALVKHGLTQAALQEYEAKMRPLTTGIVMANRGSGPDAILQRVEDICGGEFTDIEDVIPRQELADHAARYKSLAGTDVDALNSRGPLIPNYSPFVGD